MNKNKNINLIPLFNAVEKEGLPAEDFHKTPSSMLGFAGALLKNNEELTQLAYTDCLTKLKNRSALQKNVGDKRSYSSSEKGDSILMIDLDKFKDINDTHGHAAGDAVLQEFSSRLEGCLRTSDGFSSLGGGAFRLGGDEFVVALWGCDAENAKRIVQIIEKKCFTGPVVFGELTLPLAGSIGFAHCPEGVTTAELLEQTIKDADVVLYEAKRARKGPEIIENYSIQPGVIAYLEKGKTQDWISSAEKRFLNPFPS